MANRLTMISDSDPMEKEQKHRSAKRGGKRRLRVYRGGSWERYPVPQLRLEGKWLEDYGFVPKTG